MGASLVVWWSRIRLARQRHQQARRPRRSRRTGVLTGTVTSKHTWAAGGLERGSCSYFTDDVTLYRENAKQSMGKLLEVRNELTQQGD